MILIAKIKKTIFNKDDYYVFEGWIGESDTFSGERTVFIYCGANPPKAYKTIDYLFDGQFKKNKFGDNFYIKSYKKMGILPEKTKKRWSVVRDEMQLELCL